MYSPSPLPLFNIPPKNQSKSNVVINGFIFLELKLSTVLRAKLLQSAIFHQSPRERGKGERDTRWKRGIETTRKRLGEGIHFPVLSVGYKSNLVTTLRGPGGSMWMGNDTRRNTKVPATKEKVIKPKQRGSLPVHLRNEGNSGEERQSGGAHKGIGIVKIFFLIFFY